MALPNKSAIRSRRPTFLNKWRRLPLAVAAALIGSTAADAQTYTWTGNAAGNFSNIQNWNFGAGLIPASSGTGELIFQSFGTSSYTASNDLNLSLQKLTLNTYSTSGISVASTLSGNFAFTGAAEVNQNGSGGGNVLTIGMTLGSTATGLTFQGAGLANTTISGIIASNTAAGAPLRISLGTAVPNAGIVTLSGSNTFAGGVVLNGGNLSLGNQNAIGVFGNNLNTLTVNGGSLQGSQTILNPVVLNSDLLLTGGATVTNFGAAGGLGLGVISGAGGVQVRPAGAAIVQVFNVANTYTGATTIGQIGYASTGGPDNSGGLRIQSAVGSILNTAAINVRDGGIFEINYTNGNSVNNGRISTSTPINVNSGFIQAVNSGTANFQAQAFGTLTGAGATTILANTSGSVGSVTALTFGNLVRSNNGTFVFSGPNLGNAAAVTGGANQGNIFLTQINTAAPAGALVGGGGGAGTGTISILPWAIGDTANTGTNFGAGTGFVTYDVNGVRLLNTTNEYNTSGDFTTALATQNMRLNTVTNPTANTTVNSVFVATTGLTLAGGSNSLTITSGALASNVAAFTTSSPILFGATGAGEAVVTVVGAFGTANTITANGALIGSTLTKTGHGTLILGSPANAFSSNTITVNAGFLSIPSVVNLGIANAGTSSMTFNMHSYINRGGLLYTGNGPETLNVPITVNSGHMQLGITGGTAGQLTIAGPIGGAGGVNFNSNLAGSVITFAADNTFTGGVRLGGGLGSTYVITGATSADKVFGGAGSSIEINAAATTTRLGRDWNTTRNIAFSAGWGTAGTTDGFDNAGFNANWGGPIVGSATIIKVDSGATPGTWTISGANNPFTGTIILGNNVTGANRPGGTLALSGVGDLNSASVTFGFGAAATGTAIGGTYALDISAATGGPGPLAPGRSFATITTSATFDQAHKIQLGLPGSPVNISIGAGTFGSATAAGTIQGFGKLLKVGTATLTLATPNTFTGDVQIWGGTLSVSNDNQLGNSANNLLIQGGILNITNALGSNARNITLSPTPVLVQVTPPNGLNIGAAVTLSGNLTGPGGFDKSGTGVLTLTGTNTYGGNTRLSAGTVSITGDSNLGGATSQLIFNSGTLQLASGSATISRPIMNPSSGIFDVQGTTLTVNSTFTGQNGLTKIGPGALVIGGASPNYNVTTFAIGNGTAATGPVTFASTGYMPRVNLTLAAASTATLTLNGVQELATLTTNTGTTVALTPNASLTFGWNNAAGTLAGVFTGDNTTALSQVGTLTQTISATNSGFSGAYNMLFAGGLTLSGAAGALPNVSALTVGAWGNGSGRGPTLTIDNSTANLVRLPTGLNLFINSSELALTGNAAGTAVTFDSLSSSGYTFLTAGTTTAGVNLSFANATTGLNRLNNGTFLFRSGSTGTLGSAAASATVSNITFANAGTAVNLIGGGGAAGTPQISIIPYAVGADSAGGTGTTFVTYTANGVRTLNTTAGSEVNGTLIGAGATDNVRVSNATLTTLTLPADQTVNALNITGTASQTRIESANLIVTSGLILTPVNNVYTTTTVAGAPVGVQLGIQTATLSAGAGNPLYFFQTNAAGSGDLAVGAQVIGNGGLVKSGLSSLFLTNATNSYTGGTTVNSGLLVVDSLAALNNLAGGLTLGGGYLKYRGGDASTSAAITLAGGSATNPGLGGGFDVVSGTNLTLAGNIGGFGGLLKNGTGTLTLSGTNSFSGPVILQSGAIAFSSAAQLGTNSRLLVDSGTSATGGAVFRPTANLTIAKDIAVISSTATVGIGFDVPTGVAVTVNGTITTPSNNTRGLYKFGAGDLTLTAASPINGSTQVFGGNLILGGANGSVLSSAAAAGFSAAATFVAGLGGSLVLDNRSANNNNRLPDQFTDPIGLADSATSTGIRLVGGGLTLRGNATVASSEQTNRFEVGTFGIVTLENNGQNVTLSTGRVNRADNASLALVRGTNLGSTVSSSSTNWFAIDMATGSTQLGGAGGAKGTPFLNIVPGFIGDTSATGNGTDLMTYDSAVGFRTLAGSEYTTTFVPTNFDASRAPNIGLTGATTSPALTNWVTAIKLGSGAALTGTGSIDVRQSTILATGNSSITVPTLLSNGNGGYDIWTSAGATLTLNANLNGSKLYKGGTGTLVMTGAYYGTGAVIVNQGTLQLSGTAYLNPISSAVTVLPGATFDLGGLDRVVASINTTALIGTTNLGQVSDGTVALGSNSLRLYDQANSIFTGQFTGTAQSTLAGGLFGAFPQILQPQPNFLGTLRLLNGTLSLTGLGSVLNASRIDLRGGNLLLGNFDDNAFATGYVAQRVSPTMPINLAGIIQITANANAVANHQFGSMALVGEGIFNFTAGATSSMNVTFANLTRAADRGVLQVNANNLGLAPSPGAAAGGVGMTNIKFNQIAGGAPASALVGGVGGAGTTTVPILPWAWYASANSFLTYDAVNGLRPLSTATEYNTYAAAGATDNVRATATISGVAGKTINSLILDTSGATAATTANNLTGNAGTSLTVGSGAIAFTGTTTNATLTYANTSLISGFDGINFGTGEGVLFVNNAHTNATGPVTTAGILTISSPITAPAGVVKYGFGTLVLTTPNTIGTAFTISAGVVQFSNDNQLGTAGTPLAFGLRTNAVSPTGTGIQYTGTTLLELNRAVATNSYASFRAPVAVPLVFNQPITGEGSVGFDTAGSLYEFNGANTYKGDLFAFQGLFSIRNDAGFGDPQSTLRMNQAVATEGVFLRGNWTTTRPIHSQSTWGVNTNGFDATFNGTVFGAGAITKNGLGGLTLTTPNPYSASTVVNAGTVRLVGRGAVAGGATIGFGAALVLDDSGAHASDRIPDASAITNNNGELALIGNGGVLTEEVVGNVTLGVASTVTIAPGSGQAAILRLGQTGVLTRSAGGSILFRGTNLGANAPATANTASFLVFNPVGSAAALSGGGGAPGSTAISVIAGAFGDTSVTGQGTQLVTYDLANGIRLLTPSEYATNPALNGRVVADNVRLTSSQAIANATTVNALWLDNGGGTSGTGVLTITAGNVLATGIGNTLDGPINAVANAIAIGGPGDVTINGVIPSTQTAGLIKRGTGTLTLNGANAYTGNTTLAAGTTVIGNASAFGATAGTLRFLGGTLQAGAAGLTVANPIGLSADMILTGGNSIAFSGAVTLESATRGITVGGGITVTLSGIVGGSAGVAGVGLTKNGPGLLVLTGTNTYAAAGTYGFYESQTTVNAGELRINNTTGSGTGGSRVAVNLGGTLSGTGTIIPTQGLEARNTVTINSGGTVAPGSAGVGTLTIGSTATPGITTASANLAAGSNFTFQFTGAQAPAGANTGASSTAGTGYNNLVVNGSLSFGSFGIVFGAGDFSTFAPSTSYSFRIGSQSANYPGATSYVPTVNTTALTNFTAFSTITVETVGTSGGVFLNFTPVPEPASMLLIGGGLAGLAGWVRRRRNA